MKIIQLPDGVKINLSVVTSITVNSGNLFFTWGNQAQGGATGYSYPYIPTTQQPTAVQVHQAIGLIQQLPDGYYVVSQYIPTFYISSISGSGQAHGSPGSTITVNGAGFVQGCRVFVGPFEVTSSVASFSSTQFTFLDPGAPAAAVVGVSVLNPNLTTATLPDCFTWS